MIKIDSKTQNYDYWFNWAPIPTAFFIHRDALRQQNGDPLTAAQQMVLMYIIVNRKWVDQNGDKHEHFGLCTTPYAVMSKELTISIRYIKDIIPILQLAGLITVTSRGAFGKGLKSNILDPKPAFDLLHHHIDAIRKLKASKKKKLKAAPPPAPAPTMKQVFGVRPSLTSTIAQEEWELNEYGPRPIPPPEPPKKLEKIWTKEAVAEMEKDLFRFNE